LKEYYNSSQVNFFMNMEGNSGDLPGKEIGRSTYRTTNAGSWLLLPAKDARE
jgi:hypothetical protein